jgi:hypothetical protein
MGVKKKVRQLTREGVYIKTFESVKAASEILRINHALISKVCHDAEPTAGGFKWGFVDVVLQERRKKKAERTYKNGLYYNDKGNVVGYAPYGLTNTRYSTSK